MNCFVKIFKTFVAIQENRFGTLYVRQKKSSTYMVSHSTSFLPSWIYVCLIEYQEKLRILYLENNKPVIHDNTIVQLIVGIAQYFIYPWNCPHCVYVWELVIRFRFIYVQLKCPATEPMQSCYYGN